MNNKPLSKSFKPLPMHSYIPHLTSDITDANSTVIQEEKIPQTMEEHFEEIEKWASGKDPVYTFGYYCWLDPENFPPPEELKDETMILIPKAFEKMMYSWNHVIFISSFQNVNGTPTLLFLN